MKTMVVRSVDFYLIQRKYTGSIVSRRNIDFGSPLAIFMVSGIVGATFLALYFVPYVYLLIHKRKFFSTKNQ